MSLQVISQRVRWLGPLCLFAALAACGGGSNSASTNALYLGSTDAPGDFINYTVTVTSVTLVRSDGVDVNVLPNEATLNLADEDGLTDLLSAQSVPTGTYPSVLVTLDYTGADIEAEGVNGQAVALTPVDAAGDPVTTLTVPIEFGNAQGLVVRAGQPQFLTLDFLLDASNRVNFASAPPTDLVEPFLVATIEPNPNPVRIRGPLVSVAPGQSEYTVDLRPFFESSGTFGDTVIQTNSQTVFDINGTSALGSAGLTALASLPPLTATSARVVFSPGTGALVAASVDAGSSVPGGNEDALKGTVMSVTGGNLTVKGATLIRSGGTVVFNDLVDLTVGSNTFVTAEGHAGVNLGPGAISVGQRILAFGSVTNPDPEALAFDADPGRVRLKDTILRGTVVTAGSDLLTLDLQSIDGRLISLFDFAGTGSTSAEDANPAGYLVATGALPLGDLSLDDPVRVEGEVTPLGTAPPDFTAQSVSDYANARARLFASWMPDGTGSAFTTLGEAGLNVNLASNPETAYLRRGEVITPLATLSTSPMVEDGSGSGYFVIRQNHTVTVHFTFGGFVTDLTARLAAGAMLDWVWAEGGFASNGDILTANRIAVRLG